jgi:hypothetical protein
MQTDFNESSLIIQLVKVVKTYSLEAVVRLIELTFGEKFTPTRFEQSRTIAPTLDWFELERTINWKIQF